MKIAILGTRGIPNMYGGFEQSAENVSFWLKKYGHDVTVYNPHYHPYKNTEWNGVTIVRIHSPEKKLKILGNLIYDYNCVKDAIKKDFDIILELGYAPSALFFRKIKNTKKKLITNMDGLDWKRSKWNNLIKKFIIHCEKIAVNKSDAIIADHPVIKDYFNEVYNAKNKCFYIGYGAKMLKKIDSSHLKNYNLLKNDYFMLIARLEPENNMEMILDGYLLSKSKKKFIVIGNYNTPYGRCLKNKYRTDTNIIFIGGVYDYVALSSLRKFARMYFHGHSVGGTNPSLLEAMASSAYIAAHDNKFNRFVLDNKAHFFSKKEDVTRLILSDTQKQRKNFVNFNLKRISSEYSWEKISKQYLDLFEKVLSK